MNRKTNRLVQGLAGIALIGALPACNRTLDGVNPNSAPGTAPELRLEAELSPSVAGRVLPLGNFDPGTLTNAYVYSDGSASGGQAVMLPSTGSKIRFTVPSGTTGGTYQVRVQAKGQNYNGAPILALSINGRQVSTNDVPGTGFYSNSFGSFYLKGGDSVDVTFTNDAYGGNSNSDRNAYVDYLMIDGVNGGGSPAPTPSPTPQSAGAPGCGYNLWGNLYVGPNETYKNIQSAVNAAWNGATIVVRSGTYRETVKVNKSVKILGECGATVKGSDVWSGFWQEGNSWVKNYSPAYGVYSQCDSNSDGRCGLPDEVFIDGVPQTQRTWQGGLKGNDFWVGNGKIYLSNNPNGHYVEVATRSVWMQGDWGAGGVTIKGLAFMHSTSPALTAALSDNGGGNWTFDGNDIGYSAGAGVSIFGYGSVVKNNLIHDNGQTGVKGQGQNELVDGNKIYNNNTEAFDGSWESGGAKFVGATNLTVQNNVVYNNHAPALWTDVSCDYVTFQYNVIHDNDRQGIHYELSNHGSIHDNAIWSNGYGYSMWPLGSGILVQNSTNTEVFNNTIAWNADGIGVIQMDRGQWTTMQNIYIHNNVIAGTTGNLIGFVSNAGSPSVTASWTNNRTAWNQVYQAGNSNFSWLYDNSDFNSWRSQSRDNGSWKVDHNTLAGLLNGKGVPVLN